MELARMTAKGQMTIPKKVREAIRLAVGDLVAVDVEGDRITVRRISRVDDAYLAGAAGTLGEWLSSEDDDAWREL